MFEQEILDAIHSNSIIPYYQPISCDNNKNGYIKFEVLARLLVGEKLVLPYDFISVAQEDGCYNLITKQVIDKSFKILNKCDPEIEFSINLTLDDVDDDDTVSFIEKNLKEYQIGSQVVFELSEQSFWNEKPGLEKKIKDFISKFKAYGCKFSLDDFGTGYSTFHPLIQFDFDYVKFDKILVENFSIEPKKYYLLDLLCEFSERVGLKTVAEFVEDESSAVGLRNINIDYMQGYHFSKPVKCISKLIEA